MPIPGVIVQPQKAPFLSITLILLAVPRSITRQGRKRRKEEYAMNFLDLYEKYRDVRTPDNPIVPLADDIIIQAGWYSVFYGLDLFTKYPYLAKAVRKARIRFGSDVWIPAQILVKICALFR